MLSKLIESRENEGNKTKNNKSEQTTSTTYNKGQYVDKENSYESDKSAAK